MKSDVHFEFVTSATEKEKGVLDFKNCLVSKVYGSTEAPEEEGTVCQASQVTRGAAGRDSMCFFLSLLLAQCRVNANVLGTINLLGMPSSPHISCSQILNAPSIT